MKILPLLDGNNHNVADVLRQRRATITRLWREGRLTEEFYLWRKNLPANGLTERVYRDQLERGRI